ncbi:phosphatidylinositol 3,4,5-trisphosphate 5-phosphatase 1-like isoform X2 [Myxocyprinus asiaticus]|uniref:phosphatidylinositol 3,4,5-trisphosphate 5-phosphatase 1-like isoform X2 n=1 Tax=Myxocyprinus asiaticus TaxID=70543 RepID=UPI002222C2E6|nr:phosphatidylinositol 3,4,5-trisphosphate 5-phosphatase 1-like isoform X2 [Myxocyprinus asiaticus]
MISHQPWYHGNITRSTAEDLLSTAGKDGSFLLRDSESIQGAYALCVLYQNCVYTYRILPNEEKKLSVQASEGVPIRFFSALPDLVEAYYKENMGLVTHLQYPVQKEEEPEEEPEPVSLPPQLPPRNFTPNECKDFQSDMSRGTERGMELTRPSISDTYIQRLQQMDISNLSVDHQKSIQEYFRSSLCLDAEQVQNGNPTLPNFKKLTLSICKNLNSEIARTIPSLEALQRVLDQPLSPGSGRLRSQVSGDSMNQSVAFRLEQLTELIYSVEEKTKNAVFEFVGYDGGHRKSLIPPVTFEVKSESIGISNKMFLKVDMEGGKVYFKKSKDGPEDKYYVHNKILQLVKLKKMQNRLVLVVETEKEKTQRKDFVFNDTKKREGFCQLLQQMKNKHSGKPEPDMITIFVGTWNMGNASPPHNITSWFQSKGQGKTHDDTANQIPHDIYVIGTQEDPLGEKEWIDNVRGALRNITNISFKHIATQTLWSIRIVVLAKPEHENRISHVFSGSVKTGIANALGNKGAVGVSFMFNGTSFGFVNSHLTSGSEKKLRRNQNYISILRFLNLGDKKLNPFDITHSFTHLFWLGDLNYRVDLPSQEAENIVMKIKQQQYQDLLARDQLNMEREEEKVFLDYEEEEITFAPTYRFERDTREKYAYTKAKATGTKYNLPSWCDRVLRKSYPMVHAVCNSYGCTNDIMTSDHSPVFATFDVGVSSQFVSKSDLSKDAQGAIKFMNCVAVLFTKSKTKFFIEYHSSCLEKFVKSPEGDNQENTEGSIKVRFGGQVELTPIIADPEYLLDQHILICIKSTDCDESYGEGCVALRSAEYAYTEFSIKLTHHGERTGLLTGSIQLRTSEGKQTEKLYDFIKVGDDPAASKSKTGDNTKKPSSLATDISNPSYMGVGYKSNNQADKGTTNIMSPRTGSSSGHSVKDMTLGNLSPKKTGYDHSTSSPTGKASTPTTEDGRPPKMIDNPLYGSMSGSRGAKDHLHPPDSFPKTDLDVDWQPPVPTPRIRSFTCSETKPQSPSTTNRNNSSSGLQPQNITKKPVVPSRSEGGMIGPGRPPVPVKSRSGQSQEPQLKPRDYRDSSELPSKIRPPARPDQPKDVHHETPQPLKMGRPLK